MRELQENAELVRTLMSRLEQAGLLVECALAAEILDQLERRIVQARFTVMR